MSRALAALLLSMPLACVTTQSSPSAQLSTEIFEDIPAPKDAVFRDRDSQSFSFRSKAFRCARFVYDAWSSHADTVRFFRENMIQPPYSWTLVRESPEREGSTRLVFAKGEDECVVDVDRLLHKTAQGSGVVIRVFVNYNR